MWCYSCKKYFCLWWWCQILTKYFDKNIQCTVSGTNFGYSFSFWRNWSTQSYSATFACSRMALLTSYYFQRFHILWQKIYKMLFRRKCWIYSFGISNPGFSEASEYTFYLLQHFSEIMVISLHLKHVPFDFNISSFYFKSKIMEGSHEK